jgi:hypothetical protein
MAKTLVKTKIVLENDGKNLVVYMWKKIFFIFGYWYPYGSSSSLGKIAKKKIDVRLGILENVILKSEKFEGIILENYNVNDIHANLDFCMNICQKWICVDQGQSEKVKTAVAKIQKVYNKNVYYAKTRYGNYLIEI